MKKIAFVLALVVAVLAALVGYEYLRPAKALSHPHIILIVIDSLRADHVGAYGYARPTTPTIDALAAEGRLFENAFAPSSATVPSMATIFTGLNPQDHGIVKGREEMGQIIFQHRLGDDHKTPAERLRDAGFETFAYSANPQVTRRTGFGQGFNFFEAAAASNAEEIERRVARDLSRLGKLDRDGLPYFVFMHFYDPHAPYMVREPYAKTVAPGLDIEALISVGADHGALATGLSEGHFDKHPEQLKALRDAYDSEIAAADAVVGRILKRLPGAERAVVMVLSDHGQAFYEHKTMLSGFDLFNETLRVPLILREPVSKDAAPAPERVATPVSLIDVTPTLLAVAGQKTPDLPGADLRGPVSPDRVFPLFLPSGDAGTHGVVAYPLKVICDDSGRPGMMFDLSKDPGETQNLLPGRKIPEALAAAVEAAGKIDPKIQTTLVHHRRVSTLPGYSSVPQDAGPGASASPTPVPWVVELSVCVRLRAIEKDCRKKPGDGYGPCVAEKITALKEKTCPKAKSFNYRKKCEFMRLEQTLRLCEIVEGKGGEKPPAKQP